jgi:hypothetical protein
MFHRKPLLGLRHIHAPSPRKSGDVLCIKGAWGLFGAKAVDSPKGLPYPLLGKRIHPA